MEFTQLDPETLATIEAGTRQSGFYKAVLTDFQNAGISAADVTDQVVTGDRKFETVVSGLKRHAGQGDFAGVRVVVGKDASGNERLVLATS